MSLYLHACTLITHMHIAERVFLIHGIRFYLINQYLVNIFYIAVAIWWNYILYILVKFLNLHNKYHHGINPWGVSLLLPANLPPPHTFRHDSRRMQMKAGHWCLHFFPIFPFPSFMLPLCSALYINIDWYLYINLLAFCLIVSHLLCKVHWHQN